MQSETRISSGHLLHHMLWNPDRVVLVFFFFDKLPNKKDSLACSGSCNFMNC